MRRPVAVTGIGVVSPYGLGWPALLEGLTANLSALGPLSLSDTALGGPATTGEVRDRLGVDRPRGRRLSRTDRMAVVAAREAFGAARLSTDSRSECGIVVASTVGGLSELAAEAAIRPALYYRRGGLGLASTYPVSHVADSVGAALELGGPRLGLSVACASGAMAVATGARMIAEGRAKVVMTGGSDALCGFTLAGFNALQALDPEPCRPFSRSRAGLNLGEAAAMLLLEDLEHAIARQAPVLARLTGWAFSNDAFHPTAPHEQGRGLAQSMNQAIAAAGLQVDQIGYVNAHGTGTPLNDVAEVRAYESVFENRATPVAVSSTKSYVGHTLGAAGALESVITVLSLKEGRLFPTLRLVDPIESPAVDWMIGRTRQVPILAALTVSAGFGGSNASLVFEVDRRLGR